MSFNLKKEITLTHHYDTNHLVKIKENTLLSSILKQKEIMVNSRHYSGIPSSKLTVSATSIDNVIEAIEDTNKTFFLGVQWHPESLNDHNSKLIFESFINSLSNKSHHKIRK